MKNITLSFFLSFITFFAFATNPHIDNVRVNAKSSSIKWTGSKSYESHEGTVNIKKGILNINHGILVGGQISIDMNSIHTTDMETRLNKKLDNHLKDEDFFNVEKFPEATLKIRKSVRGEGKMYKIVADLTIKDITRPISFMAEVDINGANFVASAELNIDRTKWDIKYKSGSIFKDLGDKAILDEIKFEIFLVSDK